MATASGTTGRSSGETRRTALVTGASGGIGLELARLLAADGYELVLAARNRERLENVAADLRTRYHVTVRCEPVDLGQPGAARQLWTVLDAAGISIDVLINNAGVGCTDCWTSRILKPSIKCCS